MKKTTKSGTLYKEDILQSVRELSPLQAEMLNFVLAGREADSIDLKKFYPIFVKDLPSLQHRDPAKAFLTMEKEASSLFDQFVMVRGGIEAETDEDIEFYRWLSQIRYYEEEQAIGFLFSEMVRLYLPEIQEFLAQREGVSDQSQKELNLF